MMIMMKMKFAIALAALVVLARGPAPTAGLKMQLAANRKLMMNKFPGCVIPGYETGGGDAVETLMTETASECQESCLERWQNSKYRGVHLFSRANSFHAIFRHKGCYLEVQKFGDSRESCVSRRKGDTGWFQHDETNGWKIFPCYGGFLCDGSDRDDPLPCNIAKQDFSTTSEVISRNFSRGKQSWNADKLKVNVASSPYMCKWASENQGYEANAENSPCLSYSWAGGICETSNRKFPDDGEVEFSSSKVQVHGNLYCANDFNQASTARDFANIYSLPGCAQQGWNWANGDLTLSTGNPLRNIENAHDCRRHCQAEESCVIFVFNTFTNDCWLKNADAFREENRFEDPRYISGTKDCQTCLPGFYIADASLTTDSCKICPKGYFCRDGEIETCTGDTFCGHEGQTAELNVSSTNICARDRSGVGCQHRICRDSALGESLAAQAYVEASDFDFAAYTMADWNAVQVVEASNLGEPAVAASFPDVFSGVDISRFKLSVGALLETSFPNVEHNCSKLESSIHKGLLVPGLSIGDAFTACLEVMWATSLKPKNWKDSYALSTAHKETARSCRHGKIRFVSRGNFIVNDINANLGAEGVNITYSVGESNRVYSARTGINGTVDIHFFDDNATSGTTSSHVTLLNASRAGIESRIRLCPLSDQATPCTLTNALRLPVTFPVEYLGIRDVRLVDTLSRTLSGSVQIFFGNFTFCGVQDVAVQALNLDDGAAVIATAHTDSEGTFALNVPTHTRTRLVFAYANHTFSPASPTDGTTASLLDDGGLQVARSISDIAVLDKTVRTFSLRAGATMCDIPVGRVDVSLKLHGCPHIEFFDTTRDVYTEWALPAANYTFALAFPEDPQVQSGFEYQFPTGSERSRVLNLIPDDATVEMLHQPNPTLDIAIVEGEISFDAPTCADLPFETIIEGRSMVKFEITSTQSYNGSQCELLPPGTAVRVTSELSPEIEADCAPDSPCLASFAVQSAGNLTRSVAHAYTLAGEPHRMSQNEESIATESLVRNVSFVASNPSFWSRSSKTSETSVSALVVGTRTARDETTVAFASRDAVPLLYLYAPPGPIGAEGARRSFASLSFDGALSVITRAEAHMGPLHTDGEISLEAKAKHAPSVEHSKLGSRMGYFAAEADSFNNRVNTTVSSHGIAITTPFDRSGNDANMVLYLGSIANVSEAVHIHFNETTCRLTSLPSISWSNRASSIVYYSRKACEDALDLVEKTIATESGSPASAELVAIAKAERERWLALLQHWDSDYQAALNYPVDLRGADFGDGVDVSSNRLQISVGQFALKETTSAAVNTLVDFQSLTSASTADFHRSLVKDKRTSAIVMSNTTSTVAHPSTDVSFTQTSLVERSGAGASEEALMTVSTQIGSSDESNELCLEFYRSPFSGTHVYRVCGGLTSCPYVPGTDARERIALIYGQKPESPLEEDAGSFSFYIDTSSMPISTDSVVLAISVDTQSASGRVAYRLGSSRLAEPVHIRMRAQEKQLVEVLYERLDEGVRATTVTIRVASACDPGVARTLSFDLNWVTACPAVVWDGFLSSPTATWTLSTSSPTLPITYARGPTEDASIASVVRLWAVRYEADTALSEWFELTTFPDYTTTVSLTTSTLGANGVDQGRYLLELRASCELDGHVVGETRSSQRLGVFDVSGPSLEAWVPVRKLCMAAATFPVAHFRFDEPVDCGNPKLQATVADATGVTAAHTSITCSARLYDLSVIMESNAEEATAWSNTSATIVLEGIYDLFGNPAGLVLASSKPHVLSNGLSKTFMIPVLPQHTGEGTLGRWGAQSTFEKLAAVAAARERILPTDQAVASTYAVEVPASARRSSVRIASGLAAAGGLVLTAATVLAYLRRRHAQTSRQRPTELELTSFWPADVRIEAASPFELSLAEVQLWSDDGDAR